MTEEATLKSLGPDVDLLIRTSGEQRLSDFLLWECAYAEMIFTSHVAGVFRRRFVLSTDEFHRRDWRFERRRRT